MTLFLLLLQGLGMVCVLAALGFIGDRVIFMVAERRKRRDQWAAMRQALTGDYHARAAKALNIHVCKDGDKTP